MWDALYSVKISVLGSYRSQNRGGATHVAFLGQK